MIWTTLFFTLVGLAFIVSNFCIIVSNKEVVVKETLGKFNCLLGPGIHLMIPIIDRAAYRQEMREQVIDVPPQMCITRDNVQVEVDGIVYLRVLDAYKASYGTSDYIGSTINLAQTTMRSEIGKLDLDRTFHERETLNVNIVREIDKASDPWGVKVLRYELKNITPSRKQIETLEKQMEAERSKRAEITKSSGEKEARINISEAERQEAINLSEGERQRRINEAMGRAKEISIVAEATAKGMRRIAEAINKPGGALAVKTQLLEQYLEELGKILRQAEVTVVPAEIARINAAVEGVSSVIGTLHPPAEALQAPPRPAPKGGR